MRWLFVAQLRPFVLLAGAASLMLNLALLMPSIYMMHVFDRVFASRSVETLVMLSALVFLALVLGYCMVVVRSRALSWSGRALDRRLSPAALTSVLREAIGGGTDEQVDNVTVNGTGGSDVITLSMRDGASPQRQAQRDCARHLYTEGSPFFFSRQACVHSCHPIRPTKQQ